MSARTIRTLAVAAGAAALVVSAAAPAMAADINKFPAKASLYTPAGTGQVSQVTVAPVLPTGFTCAMATLDANGKPTSTGFLPAKTVGQRAAVNVAPTANVACEWTVTAAKKGNAVVKFIYVTSIDPAVEDGRTVQTLVVKVNHKTGKPANTGKPSS